MVFLQSFFGYIYNQLLLLSLHIGTTFPEDVHKEDNLVVILGIK